MRSVGNFPVSNGVYIFSKQIYLGAITLCWDLLFVCTRGARAGTGLCVDVGSGVMI